MYLEHFVSFPPSIGWLWVKKGFRNSSRGLVWSLWHPFGTDLVCETQIILDQWKFQVAVFRDCWYESTLFRITEHSSTSSATLMKVGVCWGTFVHSRSPSPTHPEQRMTSGGRVQVFWVKFVGQSFFFSKTQVGWRHCRLLFSPSDCAQLKNQQRCLTPISVFIDICTKSSVLRKNISKATESSIWKQSSAFQRKYPGFKREN